MHNYSVSQIINTEVFESNAFCIKQISSLIINANQLEISITANNVYAEVDKATGIAVPTMTELAKSLNSSLLWNKQYILPAEVQKFVNEFMSSFSPANPWLKYFVL